MSRLLLLLLVELLPLDLLPHVPGLLDGLHHRILVPKQRCGVEAGQDVCDERTGQVRRGVTPRLFINTIELWK